MQSADIVLVSGGLGPTADDHTVAVLAKMLGKGIARDPESRARMHKRIVERYGPEYEIPANFFKQAEVIQDSKVLLNPIGLAPGCLVESNRGFLAVLPGVPRELRAMYKEKVVPEICQRFHLSEPRIFRAKLLGIGESWAESRIQEIGIDFGKVEYGISARPGELLLKFISHDISNHTYIEKIRQLLEIEFKDSLIFLPEGLVDSAGDPQKIEHSRFIHECLLESGKTIATAESCTGGLLAKRFTDHAGSSKYFLGSMVAYQNSVKEKWLGVCSETLEKFGAVSKEVCRDMAQAAKQKFSADYGIAITGIAGPGGGSEEKPVGLVYIGLAYSENNGEVQVEKHKLFGDRSMVRNQSVLRAMELLRRHLLKEKKN